MTPAASWSTALGVVVLLATTCAPSEPTPRRSREPGSSEATGDASALRAIPERLRRACVDALSEDACPTLLPRVDAPYRARAFEMEGYVVFDVAASAPYPRFVEKNAPPRFAHIVVKAGDLGRAFPFTIPATARDPSRPGDEPVGLGHRTFGELEGTVFVAPGFPAGGIDGGHVVFLTRDASVAISLHAWPPIDDAVETLGVIVGSLGPVSAP